MGYNSLGNIFFFGAGMYTCAVVQIGLYYDVGMYTSGARTTHIVFTNGPVFHRLRTRNRCGRHHGRDPRCRNVLDRVRTARPLFRDRHARRGGRGRRVGGLLAMGRRRRAASRCRCFRAAPQTQKLFFYFLLFALAFVVLLFLRWLYSTNFGMAINAIRDDEEKAEAMGLLHAPLQADGAGRSPRSSSASRAPFSAT